MVVHCSGLWFTLSGIPKCTLQIECLNIYPTYTMDPISGISFSISLFYTDECFLQLTSLCLVWLPLQITSWLWIWCQWATGGISSSMENGLCLGPPQIFSAVTVIFIQVRQQQDLSGCNRMSRLPLWSWPMQTPQIKLLWAFLYYTIQECLIWGFIRHGWILCMHNHPWSIQPWPSPLKLSDSQVLDKLKWTLQSQMCMRIIFTLCIHFNMEVTKNCCFFSLNFQFE